MLERDTARRAFWFEALFALLILADAVSAKAQDGSATDEPRVTVLGRLDPDLVAAVNGAVREAGHRLAAPACHAVFSDFKDAEGRTLRENLDAKKQTGAVYLKWLIFVNGSDGHNCLRRRMLAGTNPGERVVRLCAQFTYIQTTKPGYAAAILIHEELHSLGLGENPPSSAEITRRVVERCGR